MTVVISAGYASSIGDEANNPHILWDDLGATGTWSTTNGTDIEPPSLLSTGTTYDPYIATAVFNAVNVQLVLPSAQSVTCIAVAAHNVGTLGGFIGVQYSTDSGSTWSDAGTAIAPDDNRSIMWLFDEPPATDYWRIVAFAIGANDLEIGVAFVGNPIVIPRRIYQGYAPPTTPNMVSLQSNVSEGNHLLGSAEIREGSKATANLTNVSPAFLRADSWTDFQSHFNRGGGLFWAWRPTDYPDAFYAWRDGATLAPTNSGPAAFQSFDLSMRFYDDP